MPQSVTVAQATELTPTLIWLVVLGGLFYFLLIRPQRVRTKRHQELVSSLEVGDEIMTRGGLYGVIRKLDEDSMVIEVEDGSRLRLARWAVGAKRS